MFYGDLVSNIFLRQYHSSTSNSSNCDAPETAGFRNGTLPEHLAEAKTKICSPFSASLIQSDFEGSRPISRLQSVDQSKPFYSITPMNSSWEHREDRRNKYGLISQFVAGVNTSIPHSVRWNLNGMNQSKIYFIQIRHMRTYMNAGVCFQHYLII